MKNAETQEADAAKVARFKTVLGGFIDQYSRIHTSSRLCVGSLSTETIWQRESLGLWIIEADGVTRRLQSDGQDERIFRILVENGINIHAEVIPRSRFKQMVEGSSRTAFSCSFFAHREIVYSKDPSIASWFKKANALATKDQERELLVFYVDDPRPPSCKSAWIRKTTSNWRRRCVSCCAQHRTHGNHPARTHLRRRRDLSRDRRKSRHFSDNLPRCARREAKESTRAHESARPQRSTAISISTTRLT